MRIVCPECAAAYDVPDAAIQHRRTVRCARCGATWPPSPASASGPPPVREAAAAAAVSAAAQAAEPPPAGAPQGARGNPDPEASAPFGWSGQGSRIVAQHDRIEQLLSAETAGNDGGASAPGALRVGLGWLASIGVLAVAGWAAIYWRHELVALWPASERVFAALGFPS